MWEAPLLLAAFAFGSPQQPPAPLRGRVVDPHGQPVVNATVQVTAAGKALRPARSDGSGCFLVATGASGRVQVEVVDQLGDRAAALVELDGDPFLELRTAPVRRLAGSVHDADGAPLAGAWVAAVPLGHPDLEAFGELVQTAADGSFVLAGTTFARTAVRAWHPDHAGATAEVAAGAVAAPLRLQMASDLPIRRTFELREASPAQLAAARLELSLLAEGVRLPCPPPLRMLAIAEGSAWSVRGWPRGDAMQARATVPGAALDPAGAEIHGDMGDMTRRFFVVTVANAPLQGRLVAENCTLPREGLRLALRRQHESWIAFRTDADGKFASPVPLPDHDRFELRCLDPDFVLATETERHAHPLLPLAPHPSWSHDPDRVLEVKVRKAGAVHARLCAADGTPQPGLEVVLLDEARADIALVQPRLGTVKLAAVIALARSDADGQVTFRGLDLSQDTTIGLQAIGGAAWLETTIDVPAAGPIELGSLALVSRPPLVGSVEDATGRTVPGAWLEILEAEGRVRSRVIPVDRSGRFTIDVMPGKVWIRVLGSDSLQAISDPSQPIVVRP
ncbi:MAG: carboxypeptidase-like regulatory domain-containing protein [Planctomycetes bacterium]|jgi:hypothetical protein|nr:carboxypeptidase-like regulatory domain-containing protein [Planctomycetota bacterium]